MFYALSLLIFLFGLTVGSFLNCVIFRLDIRGKSALTGRSFCLYCKHKLAWFDLIPVISFLALRGKCRYCHKKISWQYPLVELFTALLFVLIFDLCFPISGLFSFTSLIYLLVISCFLVIIFVYDLKKFLILDKVIYPAILLVIVYNLYDIHHLVCNSFPAATGATLFFLAIFLISKGKWLGFGDVKLVFFLGLLLSFPNILVALFLSFIIGSVVGVGLITLGKKTMKSEVPFAPFLVVASFIAMFWGSSIIDWYLSFILY